MNSTTKTLNQLTEEIAALEALVESLQEDGQCWSFFRHLPVKVQEDLIEYHRNPFALNKALAELMDRPSMTYEYPDNDKRLFEEAGIEADTYRGGGWFALRTILVNFHKRCQALKI